MKDVDYAIPAAFVVDTAGAIRWRYVGERAPDRPTVDVVLEVLDRLRPPVADR